MDQIRQGDVMLERVDAVPESARSVAVKDRIVLAEGEATGHAHTVDAEDCELYERDGVLYLNARRETALTHQEHAPITLAPGTYRVKRQREYSPEAIRNVAD